MSGARRGDAAIAHYDALLRVDRLAGDLGPDLVLRVGDLPVSKPLRGWLAGLHRTPQIALDPEGAWQDPDAAVSLSLPLEPVRMLSTLTEFFALDDGPEPAQDEWLARWRSADERAAQAIAGALAGGLSEPLVAAELGSLLPARATLFVASSMPVRDIESFWPVRPDPPRVLCNRGANGIDGIVSSAFGVAAAGEGPVVLLIGDVALAHDLGGLLAARRLDLKLTIVLLDNGGGGIFDFLEVARSPLAGGEFYEGHVATPTGLDFGAAAALYGLSHERAEDDPGFRAALERALATPGSSIVEVRGERRANVELHARVWEAVAASAAAS
jgi:2-succinyl-5-enolpyruvyl-6-hydroxy-3-cyclohexene-1-carboxylate synthase